MVNDSPLSPEASALLTNLQSKTGSIRGNIAKDEIMWLYRSSEPGQLVNATTAKELHKRGLIEHHSDLPNGRKQYRLTDSGRKSRAYSVKP